MRVEQRDKRPPAVRRWKPSKNLAHERLVTQEIHEMHRTAVTLRFSRTEERNVQDMIDKIVAAEDRFPAMLAVDRIAGQRDE